MRRYFDITVRNADGEVVKTVYEASERELRKLEEQLALSDAEVTIQAEELA